MPVSDKSRLVLVDGSGYIFRAFFALPPLTDPAGVPVGAVYGFCNMLFRLVQDMAGDQLVVVFDKGKASFRDAIYADYKANRLEPPDDLVPQFPLVRAAAEAFGLPVIELEGYEADDIIATYAREACAAGREVIVVSSDKDLMQLIRQGVQMYDPMKQKAIDRAEVIARFGVGPELVRDVLALAGDTSDNVPGVPGIGVKTAAQLLQEFGDLEGLLANAATIRQPKRRENLLEFAEQARVSQRLVTLCDTVPSLPPLERLHDGALDYAGLLEFARQHGFRSLAQRVEPLAEAHAGAPEPGAAEPAQAAEYATVREFAALAGWLDRARAQGVLALDCTTTSPHVARAELIGLSLAVEEGEACYVPFAHRDDFGTLAAGQLPRGEVLERLRALLEDPAVLKVGHNLKFEQSVLARYGLEVGALRRHHAPVLCDRRRAPRPRAGRAGGAAPRPHHDVLRGGVRQRPQADPVREGAGRAGRRLCRGVRRGDAASAPPAQAAARRGAPDPGLRDPGPAAGADSGRHGAPRHQGRPPDPEGALGRLRPAHGRARERGPPARRARLQPRLAQAARRDPVRGAGHRGRAQDQDRQPHHDRQRARGSRRPGLSAAGDDPRLASAAEADRHLYRRPDPGDRARRPRAHLLRHGRDLHRPAVVERPQSAEHPDPHRGGPQDPPRLRRRGGLRPALGRLLADRAPPARAYGRYRGAQARPSPRTSTSTRSPPRRCSACRSRASILCCAAMPR